MQKKDFCIFAKSKLSCQDVAYRYLGEPNNISGYNWYYFSPFREMERTPSFCVNNEKGFHDFGTDIHYDIIKFTAELFNINWWEATEKLLIDFKVDLKDMKKYKKIVTSNKKNEDIPIIKLLTGNKPSRIFCYFDEIEFRRKPTENYILAEIKNRILDNRFRLYNNIEEIIVEILKGKTCVPSAIKGNIQDKWVKQQVFLIDFDNKINEENISINNPKHITIKEVLEFCKKEDIEPTFAYFTFSHSEFQHKFRFVYVFEKPIQDLNIAKHILSILLEKLKQFNPDKSKKNLSDMFLGGLKLAYISKKYYKVEEIKNGK